MNIRPLIFAAVLFPFAYVEFFTTGPFADAQDDLFTGSDLAQRLSALEQTVATLQNDLRNMQTTLDGNSRKLDDLLSQRSQSNLSPPSAPLTYRSTVEQYASPAVTQVVQPSYAVAQPVYSVQSFPAYSIGTMAVRRGGLTRRWVPFQPLKNVARFFGGNPYSARGVVSPVGSPFAIGG